VIILAQKHIFIADTMNTEWIDANGLIFLGGRLIT